MTQSENTVIKKFYLSPSANAKIQDVGLRAFILSNMISFGFSRGNVQNLDDGRVIIAIESTENKIRQFRDYLDKRLKSESQKDYSLIPSNILISEIKDNNNPTQLEISELKDLASALMLEQTSRGVGAITKGFGSLNKEFQALNMKLGDLPTILRKLSSQLDKK